MEEENKSEKNKRRIVLLFGIVAILVALSGATFAYFQITTETSNSKATITGSTPASGLVTLNQGVDNLHLNISASDMSLNNKGKEYYGTDDDQNYVDTEVLGTKTIADVTLSDGEETTKYSCTAKLTVSKDETDTMIEVLKPGDMILQFKGNIISNILDISMLKETDKIEYNLSFKITGNNKEDIQAYIKLLNKEEQQNYLAGRKLNIDITTSELKCEIFVPDPKIAELRANDMQGYLSKDLQGGMYRYQAAFPDSDSSEMTNWICFGTTDNCGTNDDNVDKYMYRIIGITEEGQMYLLKETVLKEDETTAFVWNKTYRISECLGDTCEWPKVDLYKRLNGEASNGNPIFINNSEYEYMTQETKWYNLIDGEHEWMYGDATGVRYNGNTRYGVETGKTATRRYWPDEETQTTCGDVTCPLKNYTWSKSVPAKIGLMYVHDIAYAYPGGNPENKENVVNSWIHFQKDGYNLLTTNEWLSTRFGACSTFSLNVCAEFVGNDGLLNDDGFQRTYSTRPVFYLSSEAKIKNGDGTKANPYILDVQDN